LKRKQNKSVAILTDIRYPASSQ